MDQQDNSQAKNPAKIIEIPPAYQGQRIDNYLVTYLKGVPKTRVYRMLRSGEVRVNGGRVKAPYRLQAGDKVRIPPVRMSEKQEVTLTHFQGKNIKDFIIFEDQNLLVLNKPSGLAVHGGSGLSFGAIELLRAAYPKHVELELVHRLDKETSGCLLVAKKRSALRRMHEQIREHKMEKIYVAMVKGNWQGPKFVNEPLKKNTLKSGERMVRIDPDGQVSKTRFKLLQRLAGASLIEAEPITGRTHQIRVHAMHVGHPIAGDPKYGDKDFDARMKALGLDRLFLHAASIRLQLVEDEPQVIVEAPLDSKLINVLEQLR